MNAGILTLSLGDYCIEIRWTSLQKKWHDLGSLAVIPEGVVWKFFWTPNSTGPRPESDPSHFQIAGIFCTNPGLPWGHGHKPKINGESGTREKSLPSRFTTRWIPIWYNTFPCNLTRCSAIIQKLGKTSKLKKKMIQPTKKSNCGITTAAQIWTCYDKIFKT